MASSQSEVLHFSHGGSLLTPACQWCCVCVRCRRIETEPAVVQCHVPGFGATLGSICAFKLSVAQANLVPRAEKLSCVRTKIIFDNLRGIFAGVDFFFFFFIPFWQFIISKWSIAISLYHTTACIIVCFFFIYVFVQLEQYLNFQVLVRLKKKTKCFNLIS